MAAVGIDTNIFLRVFIDDDGAQHRQAVALVEAHGQVFVGTVVMVEAVWALRSLFGFSRAQLVKFVNTVLEADAFVLEQREVIQSALFAFAAGKAGFSDQVILEAARAKGVAATYTFDRELARTPGAVLLRPSRRQG